VDEPAKGTGRLVFAGITVPVARTLNCVLIVYQLAAYGGHKSRTA